jgi:Uma2 family endonuclease
MGQPAKAFTYEDLLRFPEDNVRREIIDGELFVTPAPSIRHQRAVRRILLPLSQWTDAHGGEAFGSPVDVYLADSDVVEPDLILVRQEHLPRIEERIVRGAPDLVVEVSSESTRRRDTVTKRALYEAHGVPEYWFVDLDAERIEVYRHDGQRYPPPEIFERHATLTSELLPGLELPVEEALGEPRR